MQTTKSNGNCRKTPKLAWMSASVCVPAFNCCVGSWSTTSSDCTTRVGFLSRLGRASQHARLFAIWGFKVSYCTEEVARLSPDQVFPALLPQLTPLRDTESYRAKIGRPPLKFGRVRTHFGSNRDKLVKLALDLADLGQTHADPDQM